jgi:hypothetical protein
VGRRKAGGGAGDATTASGGEAQLGQTAGDMAERGEASAGAGNGGAEAGVARGKVLNGVETAGVAHMAGRMAAARDREEQRRGRER